MRALASVAGAAVRDHRCGDAYSDGGSLYKLPPLFLARLERLASLHYDLDGLTCTLGHEFQRRRCCTREAIAAIAAEHGITIVSFPDDHPAGRRGPMGLGPVVAELDRFGEPRKYLNLWGAQETPEDDGQFSTLPCSHEVTVRERWNRRKRERDCRLKKSAHAA